MSQKFIFAGAISYYQNFGELTFIIPLFKALFTEEEVMFYEKINRSYFKREYSDLTILMNSQFNLGYFQNIIVGNPIIELDQLRWKQFFDNKSLRVEAFSKKNQSKIECEFDFNTLRLKRQAVFNKDQTLEINYAGYEIVRNIELPNELEIKYSNNKTTILIRQIDVIDCIYFEIYIFHY